MGVLRGGVRGIGRLRWWGCGPGTVFVYSGQGSQWVGMGRQLLVDEPVFSAAVDDLDPDFVALTGFSLRETLAGGVELVSSERSQPLLGCWRRLRGWR